MANKKAQDFLAKKKEEAKDKVKEKEAKEGKSSSKMPEGLRKHFEKKGK